MKNPRDVMPPPTARLFEAIRDNPLLAPFILIGGTALSLHIGHRISEDLDFVTLLPKLPRAALKELQKQLETHGHHISHQVNPSAYDDFLIAGMDLADSQQDWIVNHTTKVTFFSAESPTKKLLDDEGFATLLPVPPTIEEIQNRFRSLRESYEKSAAQLRASQMRKDRPTP
jgi:hypothetical protein